MDATHHDDPPVTTGVTLQGCWSDPSGAAGVTLQGPLE